MKKIFLFLLIITTLNFSAQAWGIIGHRAIGLIAQKHINKKTKKHLRKLLEHESLAVASVWMDEVKSDPAYDHMYDWHWVTIKDGETYGESEKNPNGDVIQTLNRIIAELEKGGLSKETEIEYIRILVHLVGDIHMPLHVGKGDDMGGNAVKVKFFNEDTNLHTVWDTKIIESKRFSYTELASSLDHASKEQRESWAATGIEDWAMESQSLRPTVYDLPEGNSIRYKYIYRNWPIIQERLLQAGVRLAAMLNKIYGE